MIDAYKESLGKKQVTFEACKKIFDVDLLK